MSGEHARNSPSDAERWFGCPGALNKTEGSEREPSIYSAEGTAAHWVRAACLELGMQVSDFVGHIIAADGYKITVEPEWVDWLQPGIDRLLEFPGELFVEHRVVLDDIGMPGQFGSLDAGVCGRDFVVINDLKMGAGEPVSPERNKQLLLYAAGFWFNVARFHTRARQPRFILEIDQPRAGGLKTWETTLDELLAFAKEAEAAYIASLDPAAPLHASAKGCRWCPAKGTCGEHERFILDLFASKFEDIEENALIGDKPRFPQDVTPERRSYIIEHAKMFDAWLKELQTAALADALQGRDVPGLKAVYGKAGNREWSDEEKAAAILGAALPEEQVYEKKLISPTTAEKKLKTADWEKAQALITRADPKPTLVSSNDPRPAIRPVVDMFEDLDV